CTGGLLGKPEPHLAHLPPDHSGMARVYELAVGVLVGERPLRQVELADPLIVRLVVISTEVDADALRGGELMLDARPESHPVRRLLDDVRVEAAGRGGVNRLVLDRSRLINAD